MARVVRPGMVAVDVGANVGVHTLWLARAVGRDGRVHALEPEPELPAAHARRARGERRAGAPPSMAAAAEAGTLRLYLSR
jgi:FkbM family methyltransferase